MSGPVELPAELVGSAWDTPVGRAKYALLLAEPPVDPEDAVQVHAVARTLRWVATGLRDDREDHPRLWAWWEDLSQLAEVLERGGVAALEGCCPACQEVGCDEDCPLAEVRS